MPIPKKGSTNAIAGTLNIDPQKVRPSSAPTEGGLKLPPLKERRGSEPTAKMAPLPPVETRKYNDPMSVHSKNLVHETATAIFNNFIKNEIKGVAMASVVKSRGPEAENWDMYHRMQHDPKFDWTKLDTVKELKAQIDQTADKFISSNRVSYQVVTETIGDLQKKCEGVINKFKKDEGKTRNLQKDAELQTVSDQKSQKFVAEEKHQLPSIHKR